MADPAFAAVAGDFNPAPRGRRRCRLDLQTVLNIAYDRAGYDLKIDYATEPNPRLGPKAAEWAQQRLESKGLRSS